MSRYYCDYCKSYIKNDSARSRKEHIRGSKHRACVIEHYTKIFEHYKTLWDEKTLGIGKAQ